VLDGGSESPSVRGLVSRECIGTVLLKFHAAFAQLLWPFTVNFVDFSMDISVVVTFFNNNFVNCKAISNYRYKNARSKIQYKPK